MKISEVELAQTWMDISPQYSQPVPNLRAQVINEGIDRRLLFLDPLQVHDILFFVFQSLPIFT